MINKLCKDFPVTHLDIRILLDILALQPQHAAHRVQVNRLYVYLQRSPHPAAGRAASHRFRLHFPDRRTLDVVAYSDQVVQVPHVLRVLGHEHDKAHAPVDGLVDELHRVGDGEKKRAREIDQNKL